MLEEDKQDETKKGRRKTIHEVKKEKRVWRKGEQQERKRWQEADLITWEQDRDRAKLAKVWLPTKPKAPAKASMPDDFEEQLEELEQEDREVEFSSDDEEQDL
jgi:hypothetical protein